MTMALPRLRPDAANHTDMATTGTSAIPVNRRAEARDTHIATVAMFCARAPPRTILTIIQTAAKQSAENSGSVQII